MTISMKLALITSPCVLSKFFRSNQTSKGICTGALKKDAVVLRIKKVKLIGYYVNTHFTPANL